MAIDSIWGNDHFHRNEIFNTRLKEAFRHETFASQWVNWITDFTDGSNYKINSVGELTVDQMAEATALPDRRPDSGQFVFNINEFVGVKVPFTDVFFEDDFMANQVMAVMPDRMKRAFDEYLETRVLRLHREQTPNSPNTINGAAHRFVASGTDGKITLDDIAYVVYSLKQAAVPGEGLIGIVDPSFEFNLNISSQVTTSDNPQWRGVIETGFGTGLRFVRNIYGIDFYVSNFLDTIDTEEAALENYQGDVTAGQVGMKANVFFSTASPMDVPYIGAWRRQPSIKSWRDESKEIEYHQMSARFGLAMLRPENHITLLSSTALGSAS